MSVDKEAMRRDYEAGMTLRAIALKYGCSHGAVSKSAKKGGWTRGNQSIQPVNQRKDEPEATPDYAKVRDYAYQLLDRVGEVLDDPKQISARDLRSIASTLLDVRNLLNAVSPVEAEEQRLRVEGLRKQAEEAASLQASVVVKFVDTEEAEC